ncbi:MAG: DNA-binding response regulator [Spirochaetaceae bacterium]|nr:MAG: DNA-binding response regulator [Spirochaetaceae bacterium]
MKERILIVEDEAAIAMTIRDRLESEGYDPSIAADGDTGFRRASTEPWALIVLDVMLPGRDGLTVCRDLRGREIDTPVLMLTAKDQTLDKVLGLKIGADDYLTKPFDMAELLARVEALLRRSRRTSNGAQTDTIGPFVLDVDRQELQGDGRAIPLSTQEFKLLRYLCEHRGAVVDRDELLAAVWGYDGSTYTRTVDVHISWLRQKLGDSRAQRLIATVRGRGYRLMP